jgi:hypothetical protein
MKAYSLDLRLRVLTVALRGVKARTADAFDKALKQAIGLVTQADIRGWFKHCGYSLAHESKTLK